MEYRTLGKTGLEVSILGFGASPLGNEFGPIDESEGARAVQMALDRGINFFDTSPFYGRTLSEERLGRALDGRREEAVLCTKCGRYDLAEFDFSAHRIERSIEESLERLRTDYLDIFVAHDIEFGDARQIVEETIPALERIKQSGKVLNIGITGFPPKFLARIAEQGDDLDVILNYAHWNLLVQDVDDSLVPLAERRGLGLINASPLHLGVLTTGTVPDWHPAPAEVKNAGRQVVELLEGQGIEAPVFALRYAMDHTAFATTLVGIRNPRELEQNLKAIDYRIDPEVLEQLQPVIDPVRNRTWPVGRPENQA